MSGDVFDAYTIKSKFDDLANKVIVLQESRVFDLEFVVQMAYSEFGIGLACECFDANFTCEG